MGSDSHCDLDTEEKKHIREGHNWKDLLHHAIKITHNTAVDKNDSGSSSHIDGLDGLRGIAILFVVLYHMFPDVVTGGFLGVSLFFVLSGYLLTVTSTRLMKVQRFSFIKYYKNKILRIYPALVLTVCATVILLQRLIPPAMSQIRAETLSIFGGYNNWWQISKNASYFARGNDLSPFTHLWYLSVIMQYYLIWPLLFLICMKLSHKWNERTAVYLLLFLSLLSAMEMICLYKQGEDPSRIYYGTDTRIFSLLIGSALGFISNQRQYNVIGGKWKYRIMFVLFSAATLYAFFTADGQSADTYQWILPLSSFVFAIMIYMASVPQLMIGRWLDNAVLAALGKYSYEIYLCQYPVNSFFRILKRGHNPFLMLALEIAVVVAVSVWLHYVSSLVRNHNDSRMPEGRKI